MKKFYEISIIILAMASIVLVIMDISGNISLSSEPYKSLDFTILIIFWIDYISRIYKADNKKKFIKTYAFDLIAILPFYSFFTLFRTFRIFRIMHLAKAFRITRLIRGFAFFGSLNKKFHVFLHTNHFIYVLYASVILILTSSFLMSYLENKSFGDALWWSIVTCTTVGYGDVSPSTTAGRFIAVILMFFGIGLLGMLTGTITTYFTSLRKEPKKNAQNIFETLTPEQLEKVIDYARFLKSKDR